MKKKILCLALCALMIVASFVGCGEKSRDMLMNQIGEESSYGAATLVMYILAEEKVSAEQEILVENAVNDIVDAYKIKLDLRYHTAEDYYKTLEKNMEEFKAYNTSGSKKETEAPVYTDENGLPVTYYPPSKDFQVDLFYFGGYDKYMQYKDAGYFADFSGELINSASLLKSGISSALYENVKAVNGTYNMMPVNSAIGEYTYLLVNKGLVSTQIKAEEISSLTCDECVDLLEMVDKYYTDYVPLYSSEGILALDDVKFFNADAKGFASQDFSILAGTYNSDWKYGATNAYPVMSGMNATVDNGSKTVADQIKILKNYEFNGYYATEEEADKPFAVGYVKGGLDVLETYGDDYEIVVLDTPTLKTEDLYKNAWAISSQTNNLSSSARILAELYTNEELINILTNGVEGENYIWRESEVLDKNDEPYRVIEKQAKDERYVYNIDPYKMGNVANIYSSTNEDPKRAERILEQNGDVKKDLLLGYTLYGSGLKLDSMVKVAEYSKTAYDKLVAAKDSAALDAAFAEIDVMLASEEVKAILEGDIAAHYMKWLTDKKIYVAPTEAA